MTDPDVSIGTGPQPEPIAAPVEPPPKPLLSRLIGVILSPKATFASIAAHPAWAGAFAVYLLAVGLMGIAYCFKVDWEGFMRAQFEESLGWKVALSFLPPEQLDQIEKNAINEIVEVGSGGMALQTTIQILTFTAIGFHAMAILFATLFYLMGSLEDLRLGRLYLDALICLLALITITFVSGFARFWFGEDARAALPVQAGLNGAFLVIYLWLFYRSVKRQPAFQRLVAVYAHVMVIPAIAALLSIVVIFAQGQPITVSAEQVLKTNLGSLLGQEGTGFTATLLKALDLFRLWELVAASIGFAVLTRLSLGASIAVTFLPWGFLTMLRLALSLVFGG